MVDTRRALADIQSLFADNTAGDISAQDLRDFVVSVYGADSLFTGATKTASFTAAVGQIYPVNVSSATANIDVTFPSTPAAGDTFGFYVATASTTAGASGFAQAPYWGVEPLATTSINGTAYTQATGDGVGKWGLMVQGELLIFRYDAVGSTWLVVDDGRVPYLLSSKMSAAITTNAGGTWKDMDLDTAITTDRAGMLNAAGGLTEIKRTGDYAFTLCGRPNGSVADQAYYGIAIGTASATPSYPMSNRQSSTSGTFGQSFSGHISLAAGNDVYGMFKAEGGNVGCNDSYSEGVASHMSLMEVR